jgi:tetratricopeptide (TPR) repeat protein
LVYSKEIEAEQLMGEKQFEKAADKFKEALKLVPNSGSLSYKVGICYLFTDDNKHLALEFLEKAAKEASPDFDPRSIKEIKAPIEFTT